jgi:hypothetical protein
MALVKEIGQVALKADWVMTATAATPAFSSSVIDASTEKIAFVGTVWHPTVKTGTINIRKVLFRTGTVTINAASEIRVSLQTVSATAGPPYQPDGVQDQFYDFKTATATLASVAWQSTGNLSADRAVDLSADSTTDANSRRLAVVFEYQVFTASDVVNIAAMNVGNQLSSMMGCLLDTGSWAIVSNNMPNVAFECDDGTFAFISGGYSFASVSTASVSSTGAIRRAGVKFQVPSARTLDRVALSVTVPNNCDGRVVIYDSDGTTELRSIDVDNDTVRSSLLLGHMDLTFEPVTLTANTYYRMVWLGSTSTAATIPYLETASVALMDGLVFGRDAHWTEYDGASWTETTTRRPVFGLGFGSYDDGLSGGTKANPLRGYVG